MVQVANVGVPEHVGPVLKMCGGSAGCASAVAQQMRAWPVQSSSDLHVFGHVLWQMLLQHSSPVAAQSADAVHGLGHDSNIGLRQSPDVDVASDVSTLFTDVQQISPIAVWQSVLVEHVFGQSLPGRQMPWL
jgi:hypothetical protein